MGYLLYKVIIVCPLSYDLTTFYIPGQKFVKFFRWIFGKFETSKVDSEMNWTKVSVHIKNFSLFQSKAKKRFIKS